MAELHERTARELLRALRAGELDPVEVVRQHLDRIARLDGRIGAFTEVTRDAALERARRLGRCGPCGALWGLPFADKDLVARAGVPTRYGSQVFREHVPDVSDAVVEVLDEAGGVSLGKTSTPEFGLTGYTESQVAPPARDPWDPRNGAGGSSGGAAAAVAAGLLPMAPASDGGGSIRIPVATVGIVGIKPSRGRIAVGSGQDAPGGLVVAGPIARTVGDAALLLDVLVAGRANHHATIAPGSGPYAGVADAAADSRIRFMRVGVTTVSPWDDAEDIALDPDAIRAVAAASALLADAGHGVDDLAWHPRGYAELFGALWRMGAAQVPLTDDQLAQVEPLTAWLVREGRALGGTEVLAALTAAARFERETIEAFAPFDAVLTPALALPPQPVGWFDPHDPARNFSQQVQYAPHTSFVNVAGLPAIVVPVIRAASGHPVCVQLIGRPGGEAAIIALAAEIESVVGATPVVEPGAS